MHYSSQKQSPGAMVTGAVRDVSYDFGLQALTTFQNAFSFTLGLLTHELIKEWAAQQWSDEKFFSWLLFMVIGFLLPKLREMYEKTHGLCGGSHYDDTSTATVKPVGSRVYSKSNSTHSSYYIT